MTVEPVAVEPAAAATAAPADPAIVGVSADFPVEFADPSLATITWAWDDMHMPFALTPLSGDWALVIGGSFGSWKVDLGVDFPSRSYAAIWNGYAYYGFSPNAEGEERKAQQAAAVELWRSRIEPTEAYWNDDVVPELRAIYADMRAAPVEDGSPETAAAAWDRGWAGITRAWWLHFIAINGPYQVMDDLTDLYESATPGASAGEAMRLIQGSRHELYETEVGIEALAVRAGQSPSWPPRSVPERGRSRRSRPSGAVRRSSPSSGDSSTSMATWARASTTWPSHPGTRSRPSSSARSPSGWTMRPRAPKPAARASPARRMRWPMPPALGSPTGPTTWRGSSGCSTRRGGSGR